MTEKPSTESEARPAQPATADHFLHDCWLVEVMPPTWAWAYRRLLGGNEAGLRFTNRLA